MTDVYTPGGVYTAEGAVDTVTGNRNTLGCGGCVNVTDTSATTGAFWALTVIADATFTSLTDTSATGALTGVAVPAGVTLYGDFTGFQLTSGAVRAYNKVL